MQIKKDSLEKSVHRFTENALMRFRPQFYQQGSEIKENSSGGVVNAVSNILGGFFRTGPATQTKAIKGNVQGNRTYQQSIILQRQQLSKNKSHIVTRGSKSLVAFDEGELGIQSQQSSRAYGGAGSEKVSDEAQEKLLSFLQKVNAQTFLIGNQNQIDLISIVGIYDNTIDTDLNWSLNIRKKIKKMSVDTKKFMVALEAEGQVHVYKFDGRKLKSVPVFVNKVRAQSEVHFLLFLKDSQFGVFYAKSLQIFQVEENSNIRSIFNKKYGVAETLQLFQVPKPIQNALNIFFKQPSQTVRIHTLWRLQLDFKNISPTHNFKSLMRIYDIPNALMKRFRIDNHSRDTFIMNFQYEIYAAKEGYIVDNVNINIQEENSCLMYHGENLLLVSDSKLDIYNFKIVTNVKPNKILLTAVDSVQINKEPTFSFFDCLEMMNGNFVLFFQVKPQANRKMRGEIDYLVTVTQKLSVSEKIEQIFAFKSAKELRKIAKRNYSLIEEKCDMAFKIGLSRKQVYLQLWNRSAKSTINDYKFLLDTMDYETIKQEIQKKLKKSTMQFRQVYKLEQSCFQMLSKELFSNNSNCSEQCIKNYIKSHFLLRKLELFRDTKALLRVELEDGAETERKGAETERKSSQNIGKQVKQEDKDSDEQQQNQQCKKQRLSIDIQQYFSCVNLQLKSYFLQLSFKICNEQKPTPSVIRQLRLFVRSFKFPLRILYHQLLQDLIVQCKTRLIKFLKAMPQILPYSWVDLPEGEDPALYLGICQPISAEEWTKNMHVEQISTIYNKNSVEEVTKTVWFKRYQYTLHDLIPLSKQKILQIQQNNASSAIFYFFIEKIFQHCRKPEDQLDVVSFLESNYTSLPSHLKGRIFLYRDLYQYFEGERYSSPAISNFNTFLKMQDYELFHQLFRYQKVKKGCLLKDAKTIYARLADGSQIYNQSLLRYFTSDLSEISDLKCILNRLNNQKLQFHSENEGIYQVLVRGMQTKLKLGSDNDIPLEEVMIYVENIPLSKQNPVIEELKIVQKINSQAERFKKMKINLSFLEIIEREEYVVGELLNYEIRQRNLMGITEDEEFMTKTYEILAEVQIVKEMIYKDKFPELEYFLYLNKLLQHKEMIHFAKMVLADPHLAAEYIADEIVLQNLVLYMVKWRLQQRTYVANEDYLMELYTILPEDNSVRRYLQAQTQFAIMLSSPQHPVQYPLAATPVDGNDPGISNQITSIRLNEIELLFQPLSAQFVVGLDVGRLIGLVKEMERFYEEDIIQVADIEEMCIKRLLGLREVHEAIRMLKRSVEQRGDRENFAAVYCFLVLDIIIADLSDSHRRDLAKIVFYTFSHPLKLIDVIERRLSRPFSNEEEQAFLTEELDRVKSLKCYDPNNLLFDGELMAKLREKQEWYNGQFEELIFQTWASVANKRKDFSASFDYTWIFVMLLHNPYALSKYILVKEQNLNIRIVRSYLSYVFKQQIFNGVNVLLLAKRVFIIALGSLDFQLTPQHLSSEYKGVGLEQQQQEIELDEEIKSNFYCKLIKSIKTFSKKLQAIKSKPAVLDPVGKKMKIEKLLSRQLSIVQDQSVEYPFNDSDDNYEGNEQEEQAKRAAVKKPTRQKSEKKLLRQQQQKNLALYLSSAGDDNSQLRKTTPHLLKTSFNFHPSKNAQFQSMHMSRRDRQRKKSDNNMMQTTTQFPRIDRTDSIGGDVVEDYVVVDMSKSQNFTGSPKQEVMFVSEENKLRPNVETEAWRSVGYSPHVSQGDGSYSELESPTKPVQVGITSSIVRVEVEEEGREGDFRVNVQEINDEDYTAPERLVKQLMEDYGQSETEPVFNLSLIENEKGKDFGDFSSYLQQVVIAAYEWRDKPLSLMLQLIGQIQANYRELVVRGQFFKVYVALQSFNTKYKYNLPIREMFPIEGVFLQSADLRVLFQFVKERILSYVDFDNILVVAKVVHFSFQKSDIKDELYYSYLCHAIEQYGGDTQATEQELVMQKQRIGGIVEQVILVNIFVERAHALLSNIAIPERRGEIAGIIREALRKKKKENLIAEFNRVTAAL